MKNPITFSTGALYQFIDDSDKNYFNNLINQLKEFKFEGFELGFQKIKRLDNFNLSKENLQFLKKLKYNTIHSPTDYEFKDNKESHKYLEQINKIYKKIKAKNVVFHTCFSKNYEILKNYNFNYCIENDDIRNPDFNKIHQVREFLKNNKSYNFTFDFAHAYSVYKDELLDFVKEFKPRIKEVHMAILKNWRHFFIHKSDIDDLMIEFKNLIRKDAIIVSELSLTSKKQISLIAKELDYLKKL